MGGLRIHGEASLGSKQERYSKPQSSPRSHHTSPRLSSQERPSCERRKSSRSSSSGNSSSSSSSISKRSFQDLRSKMESLINRLTNVEKDLQADRERSNQATSTAAARDEKLEKDIGELRETIRCINKEVQTLQKDIAWVKEQQGGAREQSQHRRDGREGDRRVRVEWERLILRVGGGGVHGRM
ncbi:MAG: hypothetical protein Q9213_003672 [Squamulea squamosa]